MISALFSKFLKNRGSARLLPYFVSTDCLRIALTSEVRVSPHHARFIPYHSACTSY
jgi:hypothetical protein